MSDKAKAFTALTACKSIVSWRHHYAKIIRPPLAHVLRSTVTVGNERHT